MTTQQQTAGILYHVSVAPFIQLWKAGIITQEDIRVIVTILSEKYHAIFVYYFEMQLFLS